MQLPVLLTSERSLVQDVGPSAGIKRGQQAFRLPSCQNLPEYPQFLQSIGMGYVIALVHGKLWSFNRHNSNVTWNREPGGKQPRRYTMN